MCGLASVPHSHCAALTRYRKNRIDPSNRKILQKHPTHLGLLPRIIHESPRLSHKSFNRKPEACALRVGEHTDRPKRRRANLRSVPACG